jgi:hypothetical protein
MIETMDCGLLEATEEEEEAEHTCTVLIPESSAWISRQLRMSCYMRPVAQNSNQKEVFPRQLLVVPVMWSAAGGRQLQLIPIWVFTLMWNEFIKEEEDGKQPKLDMTLKNAFHLQQYEKQLKKESNASLTLIPIADANKRLHQELCGRDHASQFQFPEAL